MSQNEEKSREELRAQLEKTLRLADAATDKLTRDRVGTENVIRVDDVMESPKLAE